MWRRLVGSVGIVVASGLLFSACGAVDEDALTDAQSSPSDTAIVVDDVAADDVMAADTAAEEPEALALRESDAGSEEIAEDPDTSAAPETSAAPATPAPESLPPIDELDEGLSEFADCLNENGVDVVSFTLQDMVAKASGMPLVESRADMFAFFLDADGTDPVFIDAVDVCNPIVDAIPGLGAFLPDA